MRAAVERLAEEEPDLGNVTTFEAGLAFSLLAFAEAGIEIAVVECGVGGLHDATNVLDPLAVALGPISYDHTATLGPTLTEIASEKAGIFRAGRLAVSAPQPPEAQAVVERAARERGARSGVVGERGAWQSDGEDWRGTPTTRRAPAASRSAGGAATSTASRRRCSGGTSARTPRRRWR